MYLYIYINFIDRKKIMDFKFDWLHWKTVKYLFYGFLEYVGQDKNTLRVPYRVKQILFII